MVPLPEPHRPLRVLAIEDDPDLRTFYRAVLQDEGYEVRLASNGLDGLRALDWSPDLILVDLLMPVMDGSEFLRKLRASPAVRDVPVMVLSATPPGDAADLGAQSVILKPFDVSELLRTIATYQDRHAPAGATGRRSAV
jgi:CheY-like chemotaxis protein